jgi:uncharacterized protein (DUF2147 family)
MGGAPDFTHKASTRRKADGPVHEVTRFRRSQAGKRIEIEIAPCGDRLCAKIVWFKRPNGDNGLPLADVKNKDPAFRTRPPLGLNVLQGLRAAGGNNWEDGDVYNPDDGVNDRTRMSIDNAGDLRICALILLPLLGHTPTWTRVR